MKAFLPSRTFTLFLAFFLLMHLSSFGQTPGNWQGDTDITIFKESTQVYQGNHSCGINVNTGTQANCNLSNLVAIPVVAGETFKISFWFFTSEHVRLRAAFDWNDGNSTYSANYAGPTTTGDWEEFVYEDVIPAGVSALNLGIRAYDVGGFVAPETQYVDQVTFESPVGNTMAVANGDFETWPSSLPEPTNYPTAFEAAATEQQIQLTWTDAVGGQLPEAYLILANDDNGFDLPLDGEFVPDDFDFSDGQGAANIPFGVETFTFSNLNPETTYIFLIFPYTNYGPDVNYKIDVNPPIATATTGVLQPEIIATEPQNGDTWFRGNEYEITWEAINISGDVLIEITGNASGGNPAWEEIATVAAEPGNYTWLIPTDYPTGNDFQFRVSNLETSALSGIFSIMDQPDVYDIVINEIMYNPPGELGDDEYWEFLEIYNNDDETVDLSGWTFTDGIDFTFSQGTLLDAGQFLVVAKNPDSIMQFYGITNVAGAFENNTGLNNSGETVELSDAFGTVVDNVTYSDGGDWPSEPDGNGPSLSLIDPDLDNSLPESWEPSVVMFGTPGMQNNITEPLIQVTFPNGGENIQQGLTYEITWNYIELTGTISIELLQLSGNNEVLASNIDVTQLAWQWVVSESQPLGSDYKIKLTSNSNPTVSDESDNAFSIIAQVDVPLIVINEIMYNPPGVLGLDDNWEYLEIYNNDVNVVDLSGWAFIEGFDFTFPEGTSLGVGEYLVVARVPDTIAAFYGITNLVGPFDGGALSNSGETVKLTDALGTIVDEVSYLDVEPWPLQPDGDGPSLSLIDPNFDNNLPESWGASIVLYGTPGAVNNPGIPFLQLTFPNGGETLLKGMSYEITWNYADLSGNMSIQLISLSGGSQTLAENIDVTLNSWEWEIGTEITPGNDYKIIISSIDNPDVSDESDAVFSIVEMPVAPILVITEIMYNPPESGTDSLEFIEIYNNDIIEVDLTGYSFSSGIGFEFPSITLNAGDYLLLAVDSMAMLNTFEVNAWQWSSGALSNGGELIELLDNFGAVVDYVEYDDQFPWDSLADGTGPSLVLCDPENDNSLPENWLVSAELAAINDEGAEIFCTPGGPCITTKTNENISESKLIVYPNPNQGIFSIITSESENSLVEIFSLSGNLIFSSDMSGQKTIDISDRIGSGIYFLRIISQSNQTVLNQKIIIQK